MNNNKVILTAEEIPANSGLTLEEWQEWADGVQQLSNTELMQLTYFLQMKRDRMEAEKRAQA